MGEAQGGRGISRRDLIKRSAIAGGVVWIAPTLMATSAGAQTAPCTNCPAGQKFRLKVDVEDCECDAGEGANDCLVGTGAAGGCCLIGKGISVSCTPGSTTHTYTLDPGIVFCQGAAKSGSGAGSCSTGPPEVVVTNNPDGSTTVTISDSTAPTLSHSELVVCLTGTVPAGCPDPPD